MSVKLKKTIKKGGLYTGLKTPIKIEQKCLQRGGK